LVVSNSLNCLQAAWIVDETDDEGSASGSDTDDGMVLDETEGYYRGPKETNNSDVDDDDQASLDDRDADEETDTDSVMMVILKL